MYFFDFEIKLRDFKEAKETCKTFAGRFASARGIHG